MLTLPRLAAAVFAIGILATAANAQPSPDDPVPDPAPVVTPDPTPPVVPVPPPDPYPTTTAPIVVEPVPIYQPRSALERIGFQLTAGGGVAGFTNDSLRSTTTDGGLWDVRATLGTRTWLALEASYIGSAQAIDALGLENNAVLVGNGAQAALRVNLIDDLEVQPFLFAGAAWTRYNVTNTNTNTSDISDRDDVIEIPMGLGIAYRKNHFVLDARGEFRAATDADLMPSLTATNPNDKAAMHRYGVNANIGYEF